MATIGIFPFWEFSHKISITFSHRKLPISQKVSTLELWDQLFWIPRIILHQKRPLPTRKNNFSIDLTQKWHFYNFCHNNHGKPMYSSTLHVLNACCISWVILFCFSYIQRKSKSCGKHSFWVQGGKTIGLPHSWLWDPTSWLQGSPSWLQGSPSLIRGLPSAAASSQLVLKKKKENFPVMVP